MKIVFIALVLVLLLFSPAYIFAQTTGDGQSSEEEDFYNLPGVEFLNSQEFTQRSLPYAQQANQNFFQKVISGIFGKTSNFQCVFTPSCKTENEDSNPIQRALGVIDNTAGDQGFGQSFTPSYKQEKSNRESFFDKINIFKKKVDHIQKSVLPARLSTENSSRVPSTAFGVKGGLNKIFEKASQSQCVPKDLLLAFAARESNLEAKFAKYSEEQLNRKIERYSTPFWWKNATQDEIDEANCYNTCKRTGLCSEDVRGVLQFSLQTWGTETSQPVPGMIAYEVKQILLKDSDPDFRVGEDYIPNRCNIRDVILGAAVKIREDSGIPKNQCVERWPDKAVLQAAKLYCGSCSLDEKACVKEGETVDYCTAILNDYKSRL